ncbi:MAG: hypothetical protein ACK5C0_06330 [Candidatus Kapaibacterium sp.]|jgi:hypothetical protein
MINLEYNGTITSIAILERDDWLVQIINQYIKEREFLSHNNYFGCQKILSGTIKSISMNLGELDYHLINLHDENVAIFSKSKIISKKGKEILKTNGQSLSVGDTVYGYITSYDDIWKAFVLEYVSHE